MLKIDYATFVMKISFYLAIKTETALWEINRMHNKVIVHCWLVLMRVNLLSLLHSHHFSLNSNWKYLTSWRDIAKLYAQTFPDG